MWSIQQKIIPARKPTNGSQSDPGDSTTWMHYPQSRFSIPALSKSSSHMLLRSKRLATCFAKGQRNQKEMLISKLKSSEKLENK